MQDKNIHIKNLIDRCLKGEQKAQFDIYKMYYKAMYNSSYRILKDTMEAEDIMQEAFLTAFQKLHTFKRESRFGNEVVPFGSWLKRIVINKSISQLKKNNRYTEIDIESVGEPLDEVPNKDFNRHKAKKILEALEQLKSNYKLALTLNLIEGYDYEEIGNIMNISYQNSRTLISRAKTKLRKILS